MQRVLFLCKPLAPQDELGFRRTPSLTEILAEQARCSQAHPAIDRGLILIEAGISIRSQMAPMNGSFCVEKKNRRSISDDSFEMRTPCCAVS
jgi:hypothetical protein